MRGGRRKKKKVQICGVSCTAILDVQLFFCVKFRQRGEVEFYSLLFEHTNKLTSSTNSSLHHLQIRL